MERYLMEQLVAWKSKANRKPLILNGARQVGKTWLLKEFGKREFDNVAYVSLDSNQAASALFDDGFDAQRVLMGLSLATRQEIKPGSTLIVLDEIQTNPRAITALKYFCEELPAYAVAAAGSLLGLSARSKPSTCTPLAFANILTRRAIGRCACCSTRRTRRPWRRSSRAKSLR